MYHAGCTSHKDGFSKSSTYCTARKVWKPNFNKRWNEIHQDVPETFLPSLNIRDSLRANIDVLHWRLTDIHHHLFTCSASRWIPHWRHFISQVVPVFCIYSPHSVDVGNMRGSCWDRRNTTWKITKSIILHTVLCIQLTHLLSRVFTKSPTVPTGCIALYRCGNTYSSS